MENKAIVFIDSEIKKENHKIIDLGAVNESGNFIQQIYLLLLNFFRVILIFAGIT